MKISVFVFGRGFVKVEGNIQLLEVTIRLYSPPGRGDVFFYLLPRIEVELLTRSNPVNNCELNNFTNKYYYSY